MVTGQALITQVCGGRAEIELGPISINQLQDQQVLVRTHSVAQNPTDGRQILHNTQLPDVNMAIVQCLDNNAFGEGAVLGCDFVGTVEQVGEQVTRLKTGDRIAGLVWGGDVKGIGAYSEYTVAHEKICFKVPDHIGSDDAATVPLAAATAWLALYSKDCLNISRVDLNPNPVLIWGGSSSVGLYTIQLAHAVGIPVVAVCSERHFELCKNLGASNVFDYHDANIVESIKSAVPNIEHVFDCIGVKGSSSQASQTVRPEGGKLCTVRPGKAFTEDVVARVKVCDVLVWTAFMKDHQYQEFKWPASIADHELASELFEKIPGWLVDGTLSPNTPRVLPGGLSAVPTGFQMHRDGKISGFKVVYNL